MKVFYEVRLLAVVPKEFTDNEGQEVSYNEIYLLNTPEEGNPEVIKLNSKLDLHWENLVGNDGVAEIDVDATGKNKPRLLGFKAKKTVDIEA